MKKKLIIVFFFFSIGMYLSAVTLEIFPAAPIVISDTSPNSVAYYSAGGGIGISSLDKGKSFGISLVGIVGYPFMAQSDQQSMSASAVSQLFRTPLVVSAALGCSVFLVDAKRVVLPVTISFHTKTEFLQDATHIDMGVSGTIGVTFLSESENVGFFVRTEVFFDMFRIQPNAEKADRKSYPNVFGVIPQIGISYRI